MYKRKNIELQQIMTELKVLDSILNRIDSHNNQNILKDFKEETHKAYFFVIGKFIAALRPHSDELKSITEENDALKEELRVLIAKLDEKNKRDF